jgi:hypothetical protein
MSFASIEEFGRRKKSMKESQLEELIVPNSDYTVLSWNWVIERFMKASENAKLSDIPGKLVK